MLRFLALALLLLVGCSSPTPTPTLGPAPTPEVAPPRPAFVPTLTPGEARARDEAYRLDDVVDDLRDEINEATRWCWPESRGERIQDEAGQLIYGGPDAGDWATRERQLIQAEAGLRPLLREAQSCDVGRDSFRRREKRAPTVDFADLSLAGVAEGLLTALSGQVLWGLATGGICGRFMKRITIWRGLAWGLGAAGLAALPIALLPFPGREFVPSAFWPLLTVAAAAALCWRNNKGGAIEED